MKLIDKDALVAEVERRRNEYINSLMTEQVHTLSDILDFLDTLEVKEVDLDEELFIRRIIAIYYEGIKHYDNVIKEEREKNGGSDLAIKILDGVVDARELGIQYVIDKLKAQKGE